MSSHTRGLHLSFEAMIPAVISACILIGAVVLRRSIRGAGLGLANQLLIVGILGFVAVGLVLFASWRLSARTKSALNGYSGRYVRLRGTYRAVWLMHHRGSSEIYEPLTFLGIDLRSAGSDILVLLDTNPVTMTFLSGFGPAPVGTINPPDDSTLTLYFKRGRIRRADLAVNGDSLALFGRGSYKLDDAH